MSWRPLVEVLPSVDSQASQPGQSGQSASPAAAAEGELPPLEVVGDPGFVWPDLEIPMHGWATMRNASPDLRAVNSAVYGFTGTNNVARGQLRVRGQSLARVLVG